jgi:hypothetical protein
MAKMEDLYVGHCAELEALDLRPCAGWPRLQQLLVTYSSLRSIDLTPLSGCRDLARLSVDGLQLTELDLTPLVALPALDDVRCRPAEGRKSPALVAGGRVADVRSPAVRRFIAAGAVMAAGVPLEMLSAVRWSYYRGPWASREALRDAIGAYAQKLSKSDAWRPDARMVSRPRVELVWEDLSSNDPAERTLVEAADGSELTALDLLWGIEQAFGPRIGPRDHRFFEGLLLERKTAWNDVPRYHLRLGS